MPEVTQLIPRTKQLNQQTIELARHLLAEAEAGNIVSIAYASVRDDGSTDTATSASDSITQMLGAVDILKHRMLMGLDTRSVS